MNSPLPKDLILDVCTSFLDRVVRHLKRYSYQSSWGAFISPAIQPPLQAIYTRAPSLYQPYTIEPVHQFACRDSACRASHDRDFSFAMCPIIYPSWLQGCFYQVQAQHLPDPCTTCQLQYYVYTWSEKLSW
jgi:hypothetical protein